LALSYELFKSIPERASSQDSLSNTIAIGRSPLIRGSQSRISRAQFKRARDEELTMATGPCVFVHISAAERAGLSTLNEGQGVQFEVTRNRGKEPAENREVG
jgi:cold shock CspA family protein